jgi:hypothetical protein
MMTADTALNEPLIHRLFARVLDRLDVQPAAERSLPVRVNLDAAMAPEIHLADSLAARAVAWAAVDGVVAAGWARLDFRMHHRHGPREERKPYLDVKWSVEVEELVRTRLGRPHKASSYAARWRAAIEERSLPLSEVALAKLCATPIEVSGRSIEDVLSTFLSVRDMANEPLLLREVSSRVFWGLSKLLDGRADAVAALLDADECPFPEQPIVLTVHLPKSARSFLFVENHVAFERLKQRVELADMALIFSSGFRGAAMRLRKPGGCSVYYSRTSAQDAFGPFEEHLFSALDVPVFFWGDLDYSGMLILASLRSIFPSAQAWQPGYAPMLARLLRQDGHSPLESGKARQRPIERTGCPYADAILIPALRTSGQFVDQE